ncbi:hypothetical protein KC19_12G008100 [Ceratodon purpureus]|uniref:Secreted protein n=1 Tax=Ceratodon purpureus TaxID=3225 RepID=A0A8T0G4I7_CERPU|nr:hypothetical protein KC19_12G008100 [Ceratodon purpureus]
MHGAMVCFSFSGFFWFCLRLRNMCIPRGHTLLPSATIHSDFSELGFDDGSDQSVSVVSGILGV